MLFPVTCEGDLILGLHRSAVGTLVERSSRFTMLLHLTRDGRISVRAGGGRNGLLLAGHGDEAVRKTLAQSMRGLPEKLSQSLTRDQGFEMVLHATLRVDSGLEIYFCNPRAPWQRGANENTNDLLRQYFPKGTDLSQHSAR